jgi:hypothetical protein
MCLKVLRKKTLGSNPVSKRTPMIENFEEMELTHDLTHKIYLSLTRQATAAISEGGFDVAITHYAPGTFSVPSNV